MTHATLLQQIRRDNGCLRGGMESYACVIEDDIKLDVTAVQTRRIVETLMDQTLKPRGHSVQAGETRFGQAGQTKNPDGVFLQHRCEASVAIASVC